MHFVGNFNVCEREGFEKRFIRVGEVVSCDHEWRTCDAKSFLFSVVSVSFDWGCAHSFVATGRIWFGTLVVILKNDVGWHKNFRRKDCK